MYKLTREKQVTILRALTEGVSIRSVERMTGVHRDTIMRLMVRVGEGCERLLGQMMRDLPCQAVEVDEIWAFVGKKQRHVDQTDDLCLVTRNRHRRSAIRDRPAQAARHIARDGRARRDRAGAPGATVTRDFQIRTLPSDARS